MHIAVTLSHHDDGSWTATVADYPSLVVHAWSKDDVVRQMECLLRSELGATLQGKRATAADEHGQPLSHWYNLTLRIRRKTDEMIGLLRGIIADDVVSPREVERLAEWLLVNQEAAVVWPIDVVLERVGQILEDGIIDDEEREDLRVIIAEIVGAPDASPFETLAASLPLTRPAPPMHFADRVFVFTGRFAWGSRSKLVKEVTTRGGVGAESITRKTDYLVIGTFGSRDWLHGSYGTKIQNAIDYASRYGRLAIVSEEHWVNSLVE